jgi:hypothetical protein
VDSRPATQDWPNFPRGPRAQRLPSMVLTRYFAFLHVPRTGGQFVRKVCFERMPADWFIRNALDAHTPYDTIAEDFGELPMLSLVRNPWDWYVSIYHYLTQTLPEEHAGPVWEGAYARGRSDFATTVRRLCTGEGYDNPRLLPIMRKLDCDHYTATWWRIAGTGIERGKVECARFESLQRDLLAFFERHEVPLDAEFADALRAEPPYGSSRRGPYADYYDEDLKELVRHKARRIVDAFGYEFGG